MLNNSITDITNMFEYVKRYKKYKHVQINREINPPPHTHPSRVRRPLGRRPGGDLFFDVFVHVCIEEALRLGAADLSGVD